MIVPVGNLLDTNVISEMMRPEPNQKVAGFLDMIGLEGFAISVVSAWEIFNGIGQLPDGKRRNELTLRFGGILQDAFYDRVLDWSLEDAAACAELMERRRRCGEPLDRQVPDAMIAATALRHGLTLITRNERDFRNLGIHVINPWNVQSHVHQATPPSREG